MKLIILILALIAILTSCKFSFYKSQKEMKLFAESLYDTQSLKISQHSISNANSYNEALSEGSILISENGELIYDNYYIEDERINAFKGSKIIARARYTKSLRSIGWSRLYVETFNNCSPEVQSWAAGYLEGRLSAREILDFYKNLVGIHKDESEHLSNVFRYYTEVEKFIRRKSSKDSLNSMTGVDLEYWVTVAMIQAQTDGLLVGYNSVRAGFGIDEMNLSQIYFVNADGEVPELLASFKVKSQVSNVTYSFKEKPLIMKKTSSKIEKFSKEYLKYNFGSEDPEQVWLNLMLKSHCSALIKIIPSKSNPREIEDVLLGHTTWDSYSEMHRIFKTYKFSYTIREKFENFQQTFSSYPGTLTSTDDFYVLNSDLVVMETTLEILDKSLYEGNMFDADGHVPNYIRISVANRLSKTGDKWASVFKQYNSGTYNSQWMILDFKVLNKKQKLNKPSLFDFLSNQQQDLSGQDDSNGYKGFFYLVEQIPGYIEAEDMTGFLMNQGFWTSFNRPYFPFISSKSGFDEMSKRYGFTYSYLNNPRAVIFQKSLRNIMSIEDMKPIMQENYGVHNNVGELTISPRFDLDDASSTNRRSSGGIDSKLLNKKFVNEMNVLAISGPSRAHSALPFTWNSFPNDPHFGLPDTYNFDWVLFNEAFIKNDRK